MQNKIITQEIQKAVQLLKNGELVAFPTETVYGLGADATNPVAVRKIYLAKNRPFSHPVIVHLASLTQLNDWAAVITPQARILAEQFWPGPLTLILPKQDHVSETLTGGQNTIGIRIPAHPIAQALLTAFGRGVAAPSANQFGHLSPTLAEHVQQELKDQVSLVLDGGDCEVGIESTIVDVSTAKSRILRPGAISASTIRQFIELENDILDISPRVSGALENHYSPHTPLYLVTRAELSDVIAKSSPRIAVLALDLPLATTFKGRWITMPANPIAYAHDLYAQLRTLDNEQYDCILAESVPTSEAWQAIADRLKKAARKAK